MNTDHRIYCRKLREANIRRQQQWDPMNRITTLYRAVELGGEVGEALNIIKKLEREKMGLPGSRTTKTDLSDELADVVITADLIAMEYEIDLQRAIWRKFNETSEKMGLTVFMVSDQ